MAMFINIQERDSIPFWLLRAGISLFLALNRHTIVLMPGEALHKCGVSCQNLYSFF